MKIHHNFQFRRFPEDRLVQINFLLCLVIEEVDLQSADAQFMAMLEKRLPDFCIPKLFGMFP